MKEQATSLYTSKLANSGFVAVCYDSSHQGESGGEPRLLEDPSAKVRGVEKATSKFVSSIPNDNSPHDLQEA